MKTKKPHYVDNKHFYQLMLERQLIIERTGKKPRISDEIGKCILLIATNLAKRYNFNAYPYKEDLAHDGVLQCIKYIDNFNAHKYNSPYSYFNRICWQMFVHRIKLENRRLVMNYKVIEDSICDLENEDWRNDPNY